MSKREQPENDKIPTLLDTDEGFMYAQGLDFRDPEALGQDEIQETGGHLDFYRSHVTLMFGMYLEGSLELEEFVQYRNWPQIAIRELGIDNLLQLRQQIEGRREESSVKLFDLRSSVISKGSQKKEFKNTAHKEFLKRVLSRSVRSKQKKTLYLLDTKAQELRSRINVLRKFIIEKMNARKKKPRNITTLDSFKIFGAIMSVANEIIKKIENKNMIDSFNIDNFKVELQKSPIYFSDMNIRQKAFGVKSDQTYTEMQDEKVHLKRFLRDMDNKSSTHAQMIVSVFNQTTDRYYKHLRPPTPDGYELQDKRDKESVKLADIHSKKLYQNKTIDETSNDKSPALGLAKTISLDKVGSFIKKAINPRRSQ